MIDSNRRVLYKSQRSTSIKIYFGKNRRKIRHFFLSAFSKNSHLSSLRLKARSFRTIFSEIWNEAYNLSIARINFDGTFPYKGNNNKWRGVTISLRTGGQGYPTPIHTPIPTPHTNMHKKYCLTLVFHFSTRSPRTNRPTNGPIDRPMDKAFIESLACD